MPRAFLVIDMLNDFVHPDGVLFVGHQVQGVIATIGELLEERRKQKDLIVYVCDAHRRDDAEFRLFPPHCVEGTWGAQVVADLAPQEGDFVLPKTKFSAFLGTPLDLILREKNVTHLELVGVCTNICVLYTCAFARMLHYEVTVFREGVTSFDLGAHEWALREMENTLKAEVRSCGKSSRAQ
uniref:Cysteine hydrolase n=1 Tax=Candidatus Caldatribacterium californiense TaxID=1454726 RepID=A0A7V4DGW4_9BACT